MLEIVMIVDRILSGNASPARNAELDSSELFVRTISAVLEATLRTPAKL
jgi:hypothetical protein